MSHHTSMPKPVPGKESGITLIVCMHAQLFSCVQPFAVPWTIAHQAPLSVGFPRQEHRGELPCLLPGDLPHLGVKPESLCLLHWQAGSFHCQCHLGSPRLL